MTAPTARPIEQATPARGWLAGIVAGLAAIAAFLGVAELVAATTGPLSSPAIALGDGAIRLTPAWLKEFAIRQFGANDKIVLLAGIFATFAILAALAGVLAARQRRVGDAASAALAFVSAAAAVAEPSAGLSAALPSVVGALTSAVVLRRLLWPRRITRPSAPRSARDGAPAPSSPDRSLRSGGGDRRAFLRGAGGVLVLAATAGAAGRALLSKAYSAAASRTALTLPTPSDPAAAVPSGAELGIAGLTPFMTANRDFYRVDTALVVPQVAAEDWSLRIHGLVDRELTLSMADLMARRVVERDITLTCVSNPIGGPYLGNARWTGVLLAPLLREAGPRRGADQILSRSVDGWTCGTATDVVLDGRDAMLAFGMNGQPLPFEHGFPVRMVVPGIYGYASATKWVTDIELTTFGRSTAYWVRRGYAEKAPIKTESRIDTPKPLSRVPAGRVPVAGVAWAQHRGIAKVEVSVDGGPWQLAQLSAEDTVDTWRQWVYLWEAPSGQHTLRVRATDKSGYTQTAERAGIVPDGATGQQSLVVTVL